MGERKKCPDCTYGITPGRKYLEDLVGFLFRGADEEAVNRAWPIHLLLVSHFPHLKVETLMENIRVPSGAAAKELSVLAVGLAQGRQQFLGSWDGMARYKAIRRIIELAGLDPEAWGICPTCKGDGSVARAEGRARANREPQN